MASDFNGLLTTQLPLEMVIGETLELNQDQVVTLGEQNVQVDNIVTLKGDRWQVETDQPGTLVWYITPFSPYSEGNKTEPGSWRPSLILNWKKQLKATFKPLRAVHAPCRE